MTSSQLTTIPEFLFHTCLIVTEHGTGTPKAMPPVYVLGTHSTVQSAKTFAAGALARLGYDKSDFELYEERSRNLSSWKHGDGVIVYAKAYSGQDFMVGIDTKPNQEGLHALPDGQMILPNGVDHLHYVLQSTINYNADRAVSTEIQGAYLKRSDAIDAAKKCLLGEGGMASNYAQYDTRESLIEPDDWPYGEDVLIHVVAFTGENYLAGIRTPPTAHSRHAKHSSK